MVNLGVPEKDKTGNLANGGLRLRVGRGPQTMRGVAVSEDASRREGWIDNLRVAIIVGVIGSHVSLLYALDVDFYYQERTAGEVARAVLGGIFAPGLLFGMGLLFFVAGGSRLRLSDARVPVASS
jgi:hypothetical protein